ncbi:GGDEF domain-containing protein [Sulfurimonas sp.]|nr:GGDEF domain-containing protein [Sulfurimonas sp.]
MVKDYKAKVVLKTITISLIVLIILSCIRVFIAHESMKSGLDIKYFLYQEILFSVLSIMIFGFICYFLYKKRKTDVVEINQVAYTDGLTGLYNRHYLSYYIDNFNVSYRDNKSFSVAFIDLDFFKTINDTHGHMVGDLILKDVSSILMDLTRESDKVFRYGGEEFIIIFREISEQKVFDKVDFMRRIIENTKFESLEEQMTISAGISNGDYHSNLSEVIEEADKALYQAKNSGRNCVKLYS